MLQLMVIPVKRRDSYKFIDSLRITINGNVCICVYPVKYVEGNRMYICVCVSPLAIDTIVTLIFTHTLVTDIFLVHIFYMASR